MSKSKAKGTAAETAIVNYLNERKWEVKRRPPQGANDKGDIDCGNYPFILEVKNCKQMKLSEWVDEAEVEAGRAAVDYPWLDNPPAGIVVHKRVRRGQPKDWYVTMSVDSFVRLVEACWKE